MLEVLRIRDLALIEDVELEFAPGLNALTGETGAGYSFIMRALDFLVGERMDRDLVRPGKERAAVEALFVRAGGEVLVRRELARDTGRSRVYVNDRLGSQEAVRELGAGLVLHASQHGQQRLLSPQHQAEVLDGFLPEQSLLVERAARLAELEAVLAEQRAIEDKARSLAERRELLVFQREEIDKIDPKPGEEEELARARQAWKDRERASASLDAALSLVAGEHGLAASASGLARELARIAQLWPEFAADQEAVEAFRASLADLEARLRRRPARDDASASGMSLDRIEARLFELSKLKRRLGRDLAGLADLRREIEEGLSFLDVCALERKRLAKLEAEAAGRLNAVLVRLNQARRSAAEGLCRRIEAELRELGFSGHVRVDYAFEPCEIHPGLTEERGRLVWTPNPGQPSQPLEKIASGGELSRFLLALTSLKGGAAEAGADLPTLIFDEVDAGIGGLTLNHVGAKLKELAGRQQIVLISHWPQLAGLAERHFRVEKEVVEGLTYTRCRRLAPSEIKDELARMAGGGEQGAALAEKLARGG
jgi:DNA repair protein RecN (Recombination protein N)